MIPRRLHYVWVGSPLPAKQRSYIDTWRQTNPDFEIIGWTEDNIDLSVPWVRHAYQQRKWAKVADIVRLMAVDRLGGIYLDTDFRVCKPLDPLLNDRCFYAFQHERQLSDLVGNGVFGAEPGHWFIRKALRRLLAMRHHPFERPTAFGPKLITRILKEEGLRGYSPEGVIVKDIIIHPRPVFYPFGWDEEFSEDCIGDKTMAVHFWEKSWQKDLPVAIRLARQAKRWAAGMSRKTGNPRI